MRTAGFDIARSNDFAAIVIGNINSELIYTVEYMYQWPRVRNNESPYYSVLINGSKTGNVPGVVQLHRQYRWSKMGVDATGFGDPMPEALRAKSVPNEAIKITAQWKNDAVNLLKILIHNKRLKIPREYSADMKAQLLEQRIVEGAPGTTGVAKYMHPEGRHDDLFWALALALMVAEQILLKGPVAIGVGTLGGGETQIMGLEGDYDLMKYCVTKGINDTMLDRYSQFLLKRGVPESIVQNPDAVRQSLISAMIKWEREHRNEI